jgi:capsular polysaccharide biosynthesis protein
MMLKATEELVKNVALSVNKKIVEELGLDLCQKSLHNLVEVASKNGLNVLTLTFSV